MQKSTVQKVLAVTVVAVLLGGGLYLKSTRMETKTATDTGRKSDPVKNDPRPAEEDAADKAPRLILGHVWLDRYPEKRTDEVEMLILFGGGIGFSDKGSNYKFTFEMFEFERQKDKLDITFLHDSKKASVKFKVESCDDKPQFDACLTFDPPFNGRTKLYGWLHDEDADKKVPWIHEWRTSAEAWAKTAR